MQNKIALFFEYKAAFVAGPAFNFVTAEAPLLPFLDAFV
jgi:hypothetical protein